MRRTSTFLACKLPAFTAGSADAAALGLAEGLAPVRKNGMAGARRPALFALALAATLAAPLATVSEAFAQGVSSHRQSARAASGERIDLSIGKSMVIDLPRDAKEVFVANPKVANAVVRSARKLFVIGVADGATSIFAMDGDGQQITALDIVVGRDLNVLRQTLRSALPKSQVTVQPAGDSVLLSGTVQNVSEAQQAIDIAKAFVGVTATATGSTSGSVINSLTVRGRDQVMLKVTVAEVQRQALKQLGINSSGSWIVGNASITPNIDNPFTINPQVLSGTSIGAAFGGTNPNFQLRAIERAGLSRVLAEPTLTAISGESAKFTAGGEVPVPSNQTCTPLAGGGQSCTIGIEFKPFGVQLSFTPVVLAEGRISMRVATEVTDIDAENRVQFNTVQVPGFRVRKAETTVEVPSGGSMMTAGLIQQQTRQAINGIPGLVNLPILGALFRSRDYQRNETELMIMVTPYLAKPVEPRAVSRPDDGFVDAHDAQSYLLGRLNKIYGQGAPAASRGYRGRVGFITD
jgi:pilus assembly protein CpaC